MRRLRIRLSTPSSRLRVPSSLTKVFWAIAIASRLLAGMDEP
jgi:hypothetical protein